MVPPSPTLSETARVFGRIGLLSFGGPAAQISLMHETLVTRHRWLTEQQFLHALNFCMLLPGPEAMQLATYAGWRLRGTPGGLIAGGLFVLPGAAVIMALAALYVSWGTLPVMRGLFTGVQAAVLVIVIAALARLAQRALKRPAHRVLAALSFAAIFLLDVPFPAIILGAGAVGLALPPPPGGEGPAAPPDRPAPPLRQLARTAALWLALWLLPLAALAAAGAPALLIEAGLFFARLAVVTFGGAYAVLGYMAQDIVATQGWLSPREMIDALGLAETTPGPLILVTQFVGFLAGHAAGGFGLALATALTALWMTFAPCFLWIFAGAPYIERLAAEPRLQGALSAITAAVVGVILNLSIWFALHVMFAQIGTLRIGPISLPVPLSETVIWQAVALFCLAAALSRGLGWGLGRVLPAAALAGAALQLVLITPSA